MKKIEQAQIDLAQAIFAGAILDKEGYCGCPRCGSRSLIHDGIALDDMYIRCLGCGYDISDTNGYEIISKWNAINRASFQLKIPFEF